MKFGVKAKEKIARTIGEYFSTNEIVNVFTDAKISTDKSLSAKWRIILDAFSKITTEDGISHILEEFCHPLNFADLQIRQNFIDALNKTLSYEDFEIKSTERTAKVASVSEPKEEVEKKETEKVKVLQDINKSSYSEKVIDLVAKEFCEVLSNWEIQKITEPIIQKNNELYNQEEIKGYFDEIIFNEFPFYTFRGVLQVVRKKDEKADTTIASIITNLLHPLNYNADEERAENIATDINKYLKYIGKTVFYSEEEKEYSICGIGNFEDEEFFMMEQAQEDFEREQNELNFLRLPENREKISTLRKAYQTFINIVEVFCENPSKPSSEMNDAYVEIKKLITNAVRDLRLYVNTVDTKRIYTLEHYFIPFNNLFTAEKEYTPDVTEVDLSGKKLDWDYIRPKMHATYGCIDDIYRKIDGSDILSKPDVQQALNNVSLLLSKTKKENEKIIKEKEKRNISKKIANKSKVKKMEVLVKYEKDNQNNFCIIKKEEDFYYKGRYLNLSKKSEYYKVFCALYAKIPEGGEITYEDLINEVQSQILKTKEYSTKKIIKFIQDNLTGKSNGFIRYSGVPETEDNGKPLIKVNRATGITFNNKVK